MVSEYAPAGGIAVSMLWSVLSHRRPAAILAATGIASALVFLARPAVAYAAGIDEETVFVFNTLRSSYGARW